MDKVRARQASSIECFLGALERLLENNSLLKVLSTDLKMVVSESRAQTYCNKIIRSWLKDNNYIKKEEFSYTSYVYTPFDDKQKRDINTYRESPDNRQVIRFFSDHSRLPAIEAGMYVTIVGVDRKHDVLDLLLPSGKAIKWYDVSRSLIKDDYDFAIYEEVTLNLSVGDVIRFRKNIIELGLTDGQLVEVTHVNESTINVINDNNISITLNVFNSENRHFEHEYCSMIFEKQSDFYNMTVGCFEKEITDHTTSVLFEILKNKTKIEMYAFAFDPPLRKSVQLSCPSDIYSMLKSLAAEKKYDMKGYVEYLIDKFLSGKGQRFTDQSNNYWFMLYASPGDSKPYALWVSSEHYERISEYCKTKDLRTNRLVFTIVILELVCEGKISVN